MFIRCMPAWEKHGSFRYYREADLVFIELHGVFSLDDALHMYELCEATTQQYGYNLAVFDAREATGITAAARRHIAQRARGPRLRGVSAVIGASFVLRAVVHLMRNAMQLFGAPLTPVLFCATEEEAMQWLATQRPQLQPARYPVTR